MWLASAATFLVALSVSLTGTVLMRRWAPSWGLIDRPGRRKVHRNAVPMGGGVAIWAAVVATVTVAYLAALAGYADVGGLYDRLPDQVRRHLPGMFYRLPLVCLVLGSSTLVMLLGLVDDRYGLSYVVRLAIQAVLVVVLVCFDVRLTLLPPLSNYWVSCVLTVVWVVGLTNAFNFLDNMDGLSAGVAWICAGLFCVLMALVGDYFVAGFFLCLMGALSGFLVFNWPPASIFMGDAGSNFVGFLMGVITVVSTFTRPGLPEITIAAPLCVLAVPVYDSVTVVLIRLRRGLSPFEGDQNHFSHRLVRLGMTGREAVLTIFLVTLATGLGALLLYPLSQMVAGLAGVVVLTQVCCLLCVIALLESAARRRLNGNSKGASAEQE